MTTLRLLCAVFAVAVLTSTASGATYYSQGSVTPNTLANWKTNRLGGGTSPANFTTAGDIFVIQGTGNGGTSPHSMTTSAPWTISGFGSEVQIENGASLSVANGTTLERLTVLSGGTASVTGGVSLTVNNGNAGGADLSVAGTVSLSNGSAAFAYGLGATGEFLSGGKFVLARNGGGGGVIPIATWDANSTCEITGITTTSPGNLVQSFGHFTWNNTSQTANLNFAAGGPTTINGNFTISSTGTGSIQYANATRTLAIGGNFSQTAGTLRVVGGVNSDVVFNITGGFSLTGGTVDMALDGNGNTSSIMNVGTDFTHTGGTLTRTDVDPTTSIVFPTGTHTYRSGGTVTGVIDFTVSSGSTLQMFDAVTTVTGGGTFTLSSGATLGIRATDGIASAGATGHIRTTNRSFSTTANYTYNGSANQTTGTGLTTANNLIIANTGGSGANAVTMSQAVTVNGTLSITSGVFDQGSSFALSTGSAGTISVSSNGTLRNLGTGGLSLGSGGVSNAGTINLNSNGATCGDADSIAITSTASPTQRSWSGTGTFVIQDVTVTDQAGTAPITVVSGNNGGNNGANWVFVGACTAGQTYVWVGPVGNDSFINSANWSPVRLIPDVADVLVIDGATRPAPTISGVPTQTIARLRLINGTQVTMSTSAANTLTIGGGNGIDLDLANSSYLTIAGASALTLSLATGATGNVDGGSLMIFQDGAHRLIASDTGAVTFLSTAAFTTSTGFTGNPFGTGGVGDGATGSIVFGNGAIYFHNAGDSPFGTAGLGPVTVFQPGSEADWLTTTGFQASGRTYANLVVGKGDPGGINVALSDSGSGDFKFDNLFINGTNTSNSTLTFSGSGTNTITIEGNITSGGTGLATLQDVTLTAGSGGIQINAGGTIAFGSVGNNRGIFFGSDATIAGGTTLNLSRIIQMGSSATGIVTDNGSLVHSSALGYIVGGVRKPIMPSSYTFHVGKITGYTPVAFENAVGGGDMTVRAVNGPQPDIDATKSLQEYWKLTLNGGTLDSADLTFTYLDADVPITSTEANYRIIRVDGADIVNFPATVLNTTLNTASVTGIAHFSDWTLGEPAAATAVKFGRFNATSFSDGVQLTWDSGFEVDNLGYHVYRERNGQRTRITPSVIVGSALIVGRGRRMTAGNAYAWFDSEGTADSTYLLEAIDLDGSRQWAGPIGTYAGHSARGSKRQNRAKLLSELAVSETGSSSSSHSSWPAAMKADASDPQAASENATVQQAIAAGNAVKIAINKSGWYRLTQAELTAAGLSPSSDARLLQLYVDGQEVPIGLSTDNSRFNTNDVLEFYGAAVDTPTTDTRIYWLINGKSSGKRLGTTRGKVKTPNGNGPRSFEVTAERRDKIVYFPNLLNGEKDNLFGAPIFNDPLEQSITLTNISTESTSQPQLEIAVQGLTDGSHSVQLQLNGTYIGTINLANLEHAVQSFTVNRSLLREGANVVTLLSTNGPGDISLVDWIRLTYSQQYKAINNELRFSAPGGQVVRVSAFTNANVRVLDITNPDSPATVAGSTSLTDGTYTLAIQTPGTGVRTLMAFTDDRFDHPAGVTPNQLSTWNASTNGADMLIVTHKNFRDAIEPLANLRRGQGLNVAVVDVEDVYDEFSNGAHTPDALKAFLASTSNWTRIPRYLLLVGDSSWDPRNYLGEGDNDFVPTKLIDTQSMETASDDWLADFSNTGIPQIAVGRFPGRTAAEISLMVSKTITYEQEREQNAPLRGAVMVADSGFESQSSQTGNLLPPGVAVESINRSQVGSDDVMRGQIVNALNQGPMIVNYYGHGSVTVWTGAGLLDSDLATNLTNANRPSLYVMMTCLNGYASDAYIDSLGEAALKAQNGAVAVWASSGFTSPQPQFLMNAEFYRQLFGGQPLRLGEAVRFGKAATADLDVRRTWILLGDPAMRIR